MPPLTHAPPFALPDHSGKIVSLADFKGKKNVLLVFYPGDLTPGCTMQLSALRDDFSKFTALDTVVFGVNHGDAQSHVTFIKHCALPFQLLTDKQKRVSKKYGATKKISKLSIIHRTVVLIGKEGKILFYKHGMPKNVEILKHVRSPHCTKI